MELKTNVTIKYCQAIDRFVKIRVFSDGEVQHLFRDVTLTGKRAYQQLVINTTIVNYNDDILTDLIISQELKEKEVEWLEEELYQLCVKINPSLDINRISIEAEATTSLQNLILLDNKSTADSDGTILTLEERLKEKVVGQDEAIVKVVRAMKRAYAGIRAPEKPIGTFLFAGQTGVGKTELAKSLAEIVLGDTERMVRIDCSEYALPHEYAKLIGAPPGYVGYDDGGVLTGPMTKNPQRVVLFDEIEKAHQKVHNLLLQIMDEGFATDNKGNRIAFNKSIIILTSNVGAGEIAELEGAIGFGNRKAEVNRNLRERETVRALEDLFAPEFLNRIDDLVVFRSLDHKDNVRIADMLLGQVVSRLNSMGKNIVFPSSVRNHLARKIETSKYGARPLKRIVGKYIEAPLSDCLLNCRFRDKEKIKVSLKKGKVTFSPV